MKRQDYVLFVFNLNTKNGARHLVMKRKMDEKKKLMEEMSYYKNKCMELVSENKALRKKLEELNKSLNDIKKIVNKK